MNSTLRPITVATALVVLGLQTTPQEAAATTLYNDLGGAEGINALVDELLWNLATSSNLNRDLADSGLERLRVPLSEYFCRAADGPCYYLDARLERSARSADTTPTDFSKLVECLLAAMESRGLPVGVQSRLIKVMTGDYDAIARR